MAKGQIEIVVFLCGACLMMMELAGSRVLAPYVGTSIFVWSSLIGVILGSLSIGSWLGGNLADKYQSQLGLALIIVVAGIGILVSTIFKDALMYGLHSAATSIAMQAFLGTLVLFAMPSLFLGMVTPYAIKLSFSETGPTGRVVGNLFAISTLGSIVGTFVTGFVLAPLFGSARILMLIVLILFMVAIFLVPKKMSLIGAGTLILLIIAGFGFLKPQALIIKKNHGVLDVETSYNRIWIYDKTDSDNRSVKLLRINNATNSAMYNDSDELVYDYLKFFHLADRFCPQVESILLIGGGAFSFPMDVVRNNPNTTIDVVELDPALEVLASRYFRREANPRVSIYNEDGRVFLNQTEKKYDVILMDAFQGLNVIPFQLTTVEAVRLIHASLQEDGVVMVNMIGSITGKENKFVLAEFNVYQENCNHEQY